MAAHTVLPVKLQVQRRLGPRIDKAGENRLHLNCANITFRMSSRHKRRTGMGTCWGWPIKKYTRRKVIDFGSHFSNKLGVRHFNDSLNLFDRNVHVKNQ